MISTTATATATTATAATATIIANDNDWNYFFVSLKSLIMFIKVISLVR
ncbi:MAG: hypothetical protein ACBR12_02750 [Microcoleus sp.]